MISRVAENCFWLSRYVERADTTSRLVSVHRLGILDTDIHEGQRWKPIVVVSGEQARFEEMLGEEAYNDDERAEYYLTWEEKNPASIFSSFAGARENARTTREVVSREMWETINTAWQWLKSPSARKEYQQNREKFYGRIRATCAAFHGDCHDTMLHDEPFDFLRLGAHAERAGQTARVMDLKHHWITGSDETDYETPQESAQWMGLLRLCSAVEPFFKRYSSAPTGPLVMHFILTDPSFPRSILHSLERVENFVKRINVRTHGEKKSKTMELAVQAVARLRATAPAKLDGQSLHLELTEIIGLLAEICNQVAADYFYPEPGFQLQAQG